MLLADSARRGGRRGPGGWAVSQAGREVRLGGSEAVRLSKSFSMNLLGLLSTTSRGGVRWETLG